MQPANQANQFGFDWPQTSFGKRINARIQVVRMSSIDRSNGEYRVVQVLTPLAELHIYVSPTGRVRVFEEGKGEMKHVPKSD